MQAIGDFLMKYVVERLLDNILRLIGLMPGAVGSSFIAENPQPRRVVSDLSINPAQAAELEAFFTACALALIAATASGLIAAFVWRDDIRKVRIALPFFEVSNQSRRFWFLCGVFLVIFMFTFWLCLNLEDVIVRDFLYEPLADIVPFAVPVLIFSYFLSYYVFALTLTPPEVKTAVPLMGFLYRMRLGLR